MVILLMILIYQDLKYPLSDDFKLHLQSMANKSSKLTFEDYELANNLAFNQASFLDFIESFESKPKKVIRLLVVKKTTCMVITLIENDNNWLEVRSLNLIPWYLLDGANLGLMWEEAFSRGELEIEKISIKNTGCIDQFTNVFGFPSSSDIPNRSNVLDGIFYRLEFFSNGIFHEIDFEEPEKGKSKFDNDFIKLLECFDKLLKRGKSLKSVM